jgi:DNA-binding transcriptional MerR regulator
VQSFDDMDDSTPRLTIGEVAARTGLSVHALRYYEHEGLFANPVQRSANGHRLYSDDDVEWLGACLNLRASGMPLTEIRRYAELVRRGDGTEGERVALLREHRDRVSAQIADLTMRLERITRKLRYYERVAGDEGCTAPREACG